MSPQSNKRILLVVTSNDRFGNTGKKTGYYFPEVSHPVAHFKAAGYEIDFASPKGGHAPVDASSVDPKDTDSAALLADVALMGKLERTLTAAEVRIESYDAVFFAGGMGTMWDFAEEHRLGAIAATIYERGGVVAAVCHGPAALLSAKLGTGRWLVEGHTVAGFSNAEESAAGHDALIPYHLETALKERGATYTSAPLWQPKIAVSGRLVTGQNPASAKGVAEAVLSLL